MQGVYINPVYLQTESEERRVQPSGNAVCVRNARKSFGTKKAPTPVLQGLNMTVKVGSIYALLGASGCGKTTLLSCVVGRKELDSGEMSVYGFKPGSPESGIPGWRIGYMPQDLALYKECTIREMFYFFGRIYGMTDEEIKEKMKFYQKFLEMPKPSRVVTSLSGGQQRRVSFSLALLNNAPLLILDEPTVGVDPILRKRIWSHLLTMTSSGKHTIIITTHYIEEARDANTVGMMYEGKLLIEESPITLLERERADTLEEVFHKYCLNYHANATNVRQQSTSQENENTPENNAILPVENGKGADSSKGLFESMSESCRHILAIYRTAFHRNVRKPIIFAGMVAMVPFIAASFCFALQGDFRGVTIGVHNGEYPHGGQCESVTGQCVFSNLSCLYLEGLDHNMFRLEWFPNRQDAIEATLRHDVKAALIIPSNFSESIHDRYISGVDMDDTATVLNSRVYLKVDRSDFFMSYVIQTKITQTYLELIQRLFGSCDIDPLVADIPIDITDPFPENKDASVVTQFVSPLLVVLSFFEGALIAPVHFFEDRNEGILERIAVSGVSGAELITSFVLHGMTMNVSQVVCMFLVVFWGFGMPYYGGMGLILLLCLLQGVSGCLYGYLVSILINDELTAILAIVSLGYFSLCYGDFMWPMEALPRFLYYLNLGMPLTLPVKTMRSLVIRTEDFLTLFVWPGFLATVIWIAVFFTLTVICLKKYNKL